MSRRTKSRRSSSAAVPQSTGQSPPTAISRPNRKRAWLFRLTAIVLSPVLAFAILEGVLRLVGYGYPTSFFLKHQTAQGEMLVGNNKFGWRFFDPALARTPRPMMFSSDKPAGTYRIFVLGESAAFGDPQPEFGLPRVLETLLQARYPGTRFEVINAAMTAINSHAILPIARDCARQNADLWVVYMGNNEVVGPFGSGTIFGLQAPPLALIRAILALKATRTGQFLANLVAASSANQDATKEWGGLTMFKNQQVRHDAPAMDRVYANFAHNLDDILKFGRDHGIKVVLSSVASNLRDCAPFASLHRPDLSESDLQQWEGFYQAGAKAEAAGQTAQAIEFFQQADRLDNQFAELHFRWARCELALGRTEQAQQHFAAARDLDSLRFRADSQLNDIIRRAVTNRESERIVFCDGEQVLARQSPAELPGHELFYEHVHPTFEGNYWLARALADQVSQLLPPAITQQTNSAASWLSTQECVHRLAWSDWASAEVLRMMLARISDPPFTGQLDHAAQKQRFQNQLAALSSAQGSNGPQRAADACREAIALSPKDWVLYDLLGRALRESGDSAGAADAWRQVTELMPFEIGAQGRLGLILNKMGRSEEAIEIFQKMLATDPKQAEALTGIGLALTHDKKFAEAIRYYEQALRLSPYSMDAHLNLALALQAQGDTNAAVTHFSKGMRRSPRNAEALVTLGQMCFDQGWTEAAITNFTGAATLDPTDGMTRFHLGRALAAAGRRREALVQFTDAVRLNPNLAEARVGLGIELGRQGKNREALEQFEQAVRLSPDLMLAHLNFAIALKTQQRIPEAIEQFQQVLRLDPTNAVAKQHLRQLTSP